MGKWECYRCSYVSEGQDPPDECPRCHHSVSFWIERDEENELTVKDFVRTKLLKLDAGLSMLDAARLMRRNDAGSVLVTLNGEYVGIITERDVLSKVAAEDLLPSKVPLKSAMSKNILSVKSDTPVGEALKLMAKHHVRRLLVTENEKPIGMVSLRSIVGGSFRLPKQTDDDGD